MFMGMLLNLFWTEPDVQSLKRTARYKDFRSNAKRYHDVPQTMC